MDWHCLLRWPLMLQWNHVYLWPGLQNVVLYCSLFELSSFTDYNSWWVQSITFILNQIIVHATTSGETLSLWGDTKFTSKVTCNQKGYIRPLFADWITFNLNHIPERRSYMFGVYISWTTIVVHSRDDKEVGVAHEVKSPENQPQFSQTTMG